MKVGSYVICVDDGNWWSDIHVYFDKLPEAGQIYRIRRIIPNLRIPDGPDGLALEEIYGRWIRVETWDHRVVFEEVHFRKNRFQEIVYVPPLEVSIEEEAVA